MAARAPAGEPTPSRRVVLAGTLALLVPSATLGGCRLRLEDDAPFVPFVPRKSIPDEQLLVEHYRQARALADLTSATPDVPLSPSLAAAHARHVAVLRTVLTTGGVPLSTVEATGSGSSLTATEGPGASTGARRAGGPAALAAAHADAVTAAALSRLGNAGPSRSLLTALATCRASAATLLGTAPAWPSGSRLPPAVAKAALEPTRQAVYATEVAAARSPSERDKYLKLLAALQHRVILLQGGARVVDAGPLGYRLPFAVATSDDAQRLVRTALAGLVDRGLDEVGDLPVGSDLTEVVRLHTEATVLACQWGTSLPPFPGLAGP